ncbi:MAG TPA: ribosomal-protein-alanine N-acetyltransferase [Dehalococcoidia bacterium]|jgi:[ribosomal protein S18]-alanine N-acetyltransferase|nr:ribosomal-protein-alanine N-acetyltransferase [Dehalococcoidia bacterium]
MQIIVRQMNEFDIEDLLIIEKEAFFPLTIGTSFNIQLKNKYSKYMVAEKSYVKPIENSNHLLFKKTIKLCANLFGIIPLWLIKSPSPAREVLGYVGVWFQGDEAHISEIAVKVSYRGTGIGELLLISAMRVAINNGSLQMGLEARISNIIAQRLYEKYGFELNGVRKRYYSDNREDAVIMTTAMIHSKEYQAKFIALQERYLESGKSINIIL